MLDGQNYLYEFMEGYKDETLIENKEVIFKKFCEILWNSDNKRCTYIKQIKFKVREDLLQTDIGKMFDTWSIIEYRGYKAISNSEKWCDLIKQKINNLYTMYCDDDVILNKEYINLLKTPKTLYYRWIKGNDIDIDSLTKSINIAISQAEEARIKFKKQKIKLSWDEYIVLIEGFLKRIFNNCMTIDEYELKYGVPNYLTFNEFSTEDNFYIRYICKSLDNYMMNYQKEYYGLKVPNTTKQSKRYKRCEECGKLIEVKNKKDFSTKYCEDCKKEKTLEKYNRYNAKRKVKLPPS